MNYDYSKKIVELLETDIDADQKRKLGEELNNIFVRLAKIK